MTAREGDPTFATEQQLLMPWMPEELIDIYVEAYVEYGDSEVAWQVVRQAPEYEKYFAGNRRDDGTLRMDESTYMSVREGYDDVFRSIGLNPNLFNERYTDLIEGDVSPDELMRDRVMPIYERVIDSTEEISAFYAANYGIEMTPEALIAAALDPDDVGTRILSKQIALSEIGGEASESGYNISLEFAEDLYGAGVDRSRADALFRQAQNVVPVLETLAARHADPDDSFDLQEFTQAEVFSDPKQRRRIRRLVAQEQAQFTGGAQTNITSDRLGGRTGLAER